MILNTISSKVVIARVFDRFNIDYLGFVVRVPNWIHSAMRQLELQVPLNPEIVVGTVSEYKCNIPPHTRKLYGVSYNGLRLPRIGAINETVKDDMPTLVHDIDKYELGPGYIITTFEEGEVKFYIDSLPVEWDATHKIYFPIIPDNEEVLLALDWFVIKSLLERGHKVGDLSLKENNEYLNPGLAFDAQKKKARNSVTVFDADERQQISNMITTLLNDKDYYNHVAFNSKYTV